MTFELKAKNKNVGEISLSCRAWSDLLDTGIGHIIKTGGLPEGRFYHALRKGVSPQYNDGFKVSEFEAKAMHFIAEGIIYKQTVLEKNYGIKKTDLFNIIVEFSEFSKSSGGFSIN